MASTEVEARVAVDRQSAPTRSPEALFSTTTSNYDPKKLVLRKYSEDFIKKLTNDLQKGPSPKVVEAAMKEYGDSKFVAKPAGEVARRCQASVVIPTFSLTKSNPAA